jgi:hypothetical protein
LRLREILLSSVQKIGHLERVEKGFSVQKIGQLTMVNLRILGIKKGSETAFSAIFRTKTSSLSAQNVKFQVHKISLLGKRLRKIGVS